MRAPRLPQGGRVTTTHLGPTRAQFLRRGAAGTLALVAGGSVLAAGGGAGGAARAGAAPLPLGAGGSVLAAGGGPVAATASAAAPTGGATTDVDIAKLAASA